MEFHNKNLLLVAPRLKNTAQMISERENISESEKGKWNSAVHCCYRGDGVETGSRLGPLLRQQKKIHQEHSCSYWSPPCSNHSRRENAKSKADTAVSTEVPSIPLFSWTHHLGHHSVSSNALPPTCSTGSEKKLRPLWMFFFKWAPSQLITFNCELSPTHLENIWRECLLFSSMYGQTDQFLEC